MRSIFSIPSIAVLISLLFGASLVSTIAEHDTGLCGLHYLPDPRCSCIDPYDQTMRNFGYRPASLDEREFELQSQEQGMEFVRDILSRRVEYETLSIDWRQNNRVQEVEDQGQVNNCWAYAITGLLEGYQCRIGIRDEVTGKPIALSEQFLTECHGNSPNYCRGDDPVSVIDERIRFGMGFEPERRYPNDCICDHVCDQQGANSTFMRGLRGVVPLRVRDPRSGSRDGISEEELQTLILAYGPVGATIYVRPELRDYVPEVDGELFEYECPTSFKVSNHAVLIVGFTPDFWIVKFSWGKRFGYEGYLYVKRDGKCSFFQEVFIVYSNENSYANICY